MSDFDRRDIFTDAELVQNPHPYFDYLREKAPVAPLPCKNVVAVSGYEEGLAIFRDTAHYSNVNAATGPNPPLPFTPQGDDITDQIEANRDKMPYGGLIVTEDPPQHERTRSLLMGIITPARLKQNEAFMQVLADRTIDEFIERGRCEIVSDYAQPFATLVIADLLGVPEKDHRDFRRVKGSTPGQISGEVNMQNNPLAWIGGKFFRYILWRRIFPRKDVLTQLARQRYSDGELPKITEVVKIAAFLFAAGQDTTVYLIGAMLRHLGEDQELQRRLRQQRELIPQFIEEVLRLDGTVKSSFRLVKKTTCLAGEELAPGTNLMLLIGAMNRDPKKFECPHQFQLERKNAREHLAFGRGIHSCAGAPLARAEARVSLERLFDRTSEIRISESKHGPAGDRRYRYQPTYILRSMEELHIEFTAR